MADIPFEDHTRAWWDRLNDDQRARVKDAASNDDTSVTTAHLLADTRCPIGLVGTAWETDPTFSWSWPSGLRDFMLSHD